MLFWLKSGLYMLDKIPYCFTKSEVILQFSSKDQFDNWIKTKIKNKQIKKVIILIIFIFL